MEYAVEQRRKLEIKGIGGRLIKGGGKGVEYGMQRQKKNCAQGRMLYKKRETKN
jgi:hypothetical protein